MIDPVDPARSPASTPAEPAKPVVIAVVTADERAAAAMARALELGQDGRRVVLYDVSATGNIFENPLPTAWSSGDLDHRVPPALTPDQLDTVGQSGLAGMVRSLVDAGVEAYGWLPDKDGAEDLARYADGMGATTVIALEGVKPDGNAVREAGVRTVEVVG